MITTRTKHPYHKDREEQWYKRNIPKRTKKKKLQRFTMLDGNIPQASLTIRPFNLGLIEYWTISCNFPFSRGLIKQLGSSDTIEENKQKLETRCSKKDLSNQPTIRWIVETLRDIVKHPSLRIAKQPFYRPITSKQYTDGPQTDRSFSFVQTC